MTEEVDTADVLEPKSQNFEVVLAPGTDYELKLTQKPLSFFGKMELLSVLGGMVDKAISEGLSVGDLFDVPDREKNKPLDPNDFKEADLFVRAVLKLVQYAPETLLELYCVILGVPRGSRDYVQGRLEEDLTDDQGVAILNNFVDQNWDVMANFFKEKIAPLASKIGSKFQESTSSKPSKATQQSTRRQPKKS